MHFMCFVCFLHFKQGNIDKIFFPSNLLQLLRRETVLARALERERERERGREASRQTDRQTDRDKDRITAWDAINPVHLWSREWPGLGTKSSLPVRTTMKSQC